MATTTNDSVATNFQRWKQENGSLANAANSVMGWMRDVEQRGIPRFGETASKLEPFGELLSTHFNHEDGMLDELALHFGNDSVVIAAMRRQSERDHQRLLDDMNGYIKRLHQIEPPFESWQAAMRELDLFFDRLEQHEEQESESMNALMPRQ